MWALAVFAGLFIWHEVDEYRVLVPWLRANQQRLPARVARMRMSERQFGLIAFEQLLLVFLIGGLAPQLWLKAMVVAYLIHLFLHCAQMLYSWVKGYFLPLYSVVFQVPLIVVLLWFMPPHLLAEPADGVSLGAASFVLVLVMFGNLAVMNLVARKLIPEV
ncbi:hypothetical protein NXS08_01260 [Gleimia sp. 6138-11-ORH1]|uniref:HXXEE domain-containing protein n=1 Tax=Gleimia sp. 6138-11-ORH1 TaxID=2973937 RepID=UPI0021672670|nr:HXXEE domain-containing protein [Gleimia sp. 6138-11-ORH1]MCS4484121.1 hypothetical protein [Gleimia sp. 6138-11-ORH1]